MTPCALALMFALSTAPCSQGIRLKGNAGDPQHIAEVNLQQWQDADDAEQPPSVQEEVEEEVPDETQGDDDDGDDEREEYDTTDEEPLEHVQEDADDAEESSLVQEEDEEETNANTEDQDEDEEHEEDGEEEEDEQEEQDAQESSLVQEEDEEQAENDAADQDGDEGTEVDEEDEEDAEEEQEEQDADESSLMQAEVDRAGKCAKKDQSIINKMGPGNTKGKWPRFVRDCTDKSVRKFPPKWLGHTGMVNCIREKRVSKGCATCFADMSKFGFDNCKMACMGSWCSKGCLSCTRGNKGAKSKLQKCTGMSKIPAPKQC